MKKTFEKARNVTSGVTLTCYNKPVSCKNNTGNRENCQEETIMKNTMKLLAAIMTVVLTLSLMPAAMMEEIEAPAEAVPQVEEVVLKEEAPVVEAAEEKVEETVEVPAAEIVEEVPEVVEEAAEEIAEELPEVVEEIPVVEEIEVEEIAVDEEPAGEAAEEARFVIIYDAAVDGTNIAMLNVNDHIAIYRLVGSSYYISYLNNTCFGYLRKDDLSKMTNYCYVQELPAEEETEEAEEVVEEPAKEAAAQTVEIITEADLPANARLMAVIADELNAERSVSVYAAFDGDTLSFGDAVTLIAVLHGYENTTVAIQWQSSTDNASWSDIAGANASTYTFTVTESNYRSFWRVAVTINGVIVADELVAEAAAEQAE